MSAMRAVGCVALVLSVGCGGGQASPPPAAPPPPPPPAAPAATTPPPSTNPDADAVEGARPSLRACYEKARSANPALGRTTVTLSLRVDEAGTVTTVDVQYKHRFDEASKTCMRDAAFAIKLPHGQPRRVEVPITFEAK
jgi:TonB family protein